MMLHLILAFAQCTVMNLNNLLSSGSLGKAIETGMILLIMDMKKKPFMYVYSI